MADLFAISAVQGEVAQHVILFHGLGGDPRDTWRLIYKQKVCWPQWLAEEIQGLAVWSVGYEAAVSRWRGSAMHLTDRARNVVERILAEPQLQTGEIILIGHSLGGLVIKQLLRTADSMALHHDQASNFVKRVRRVVFLATPHSGVTLATWGDRLRILIRPSVATACLVRNDPNLRDLNLWYRDWSAAQCIEHLILTESNPIRMCGLIVQPDSSDPGLLSRPIPIDANHITICKPIDRTSEVYVHIRNFIIRPATSNNRETFIVSTLETQSARIETLTDTIREQGLQLKDAISDQAKTTADIVKENLSEVASSVRLYPKDLVDNEIEKQLSIIRRARFFGGFPAAECALRLGDKIINGELAGGSDTVKSSALAWCARFIATGEHRAKFDEFLTRAKQLGTPPEIVMAEAFGISAGGDLDGALGKLASLASAAARSAAFRMVAQHKKAASAIDWLSKSGLSQTDLDADGRFFLITNLIELARWDVVLDHVVGLQEDDFQSAPALFYVAAISHLLQAIPDELKSLVLNQIPFEASNFPLASTEASLKSRRKSQELFQKCAVTAQELGCADVANVTQDYALWLELRDPEGHVPARHKLEESMRDPTHSLRRLHLALQFGLKVDFDAVEQEIEHQTTISGGHSRVAAMARFALAFTKKEPKDIASYIDHHRIQLFEHLDRKSLSILEVEMLARAGLPNPAEERLGKLAEDGLSDTEKNHLLRIIAESTGSDPLEARKAQFESSGQFMDLVNLVTLLEKRNDWSQLCHYGSLLFDRTKALSDIVRLAGALDKVKPS